MSLVRSWKKGYEFEMTAIRTTTSMIAREIARPTMFTINTVRCLFRMPSPVARSFPDSFVYRLPVSRGINYSPVQCAATSKGEADGGKKAPARLSQVQEFLNAATERAQAAGDEPIPKIGLGKSNIFSSYYVNFHLYYLASGLLNCCPLKLMYNYQFILSDST